MSDQKHLYILKPELVWGFQLTEETRYDVANWPEFARDAYSTALAGQPGPFKLLGSPPDCQIHVNGEEWPTDHWLVLDEHGAFFILDDEGFRATFELVKMDAEGQVRLDLEEEEEEFFCTSCEQQWDACGCPEEEE